MSRARATPLQSVYDRLPVGFAHFGADLRLAAWNARFAALCEYPRKLVRTGTPLESFVRVDAERGEYGPGPVDALVREQLAALKRRRRTAREPARSDGSILRIASERLADGGLLITCEDVSEARRTEARLRLSEERYDFAMRAINEGLYDWDIENDTVHYSDRVYQAVGLSPDDYTTAAGWVERIHPDDRARYRDATRAHLRGETDRLECDYRYRWRDGSWHWARQHGLAVRDASGRAVRLVGSTGDITELKERERELAEHAAEQAAVRELLEAISRSAFDLDAVLRTLIESAARLCRADKGFIFRAEGGVYRLAFDYGGVAQEFRDFVGQHQIRAGRDTLVGRTALTKAVVHIEDVLADPEYRWPQSQRIGGQRTMLGVPIVRDDAVIGVIALWKERVEPFTLAQIQLVATFSSQAAIAIQNASLFSQTRDALERQTATAEILKVISSSPTDVRPVFDAIIRSASRLAGGSSVNVSRLAGDELHLAAYTPVSPLADEALRSAYPVHISEAGPIAEAVRTRSPSFVGDWETDPDLSPKARETMRARGFRSTLYVPIMNRDEMLGLMHVSKIEPGPFPPQWVDLLKTFADQAAIAIDNVRLFNETKEALERQTATAEILKVISSSPTDVQPVLDAVAERAGKLCDAPYANVMLVEDDALRVMSVYSTEPGPRPDQRNFVPLRRPFLNARAVLDREVIHIPDVVPLIDTELPDIRRNQEKFGFRAVLVVPLLREGRAVGTIFLWRRAPGPFSDDQVALLKTFADQAVIAIENVRLFKETKEALERQTATADVLASISGSLTDTQPVFERIVKNLRELFGTRFAVLQLLHGDVVEMPAVDGAAGFERLRDRYPRPLDDTTVGGRAMLSKETLQFAPVLDNPATPSATIGFARDFGFNSVIFTPMIHEGTVIGAIGAAHPGAKGFDERQVALLKTFADQAVIAIQNARLFQELQAKNVALTAALEQQTATGEILRVISSSPTDLAPVFDAVAKSVARLCDAPDVVVITAEGGAMRFAASVGAFGGTFGPDLTIPIDRGSVAGRAVVERRTVHVHDLAAMPEDEYPVGRSLQRRYGHRTMVATPLLHGAAALGAIAMLRTEVRPFSERQLALLQMFADQAVIAIQNVRLFNETKEALERQTATAEILRVISSSPTDLAPVFEAILESALRLCEGNVAAVWQFDGAHLHFAKGKGGSNEGAAYLQQHPLPLGTYNPTPQAGLERRPVHVLDVFADARYRPLIAPDTYGTVPNAGTVLAVPLLRGAELLGVITIWRHYKRLFSDRQIAMVTTFADQAVIAIENVRLFNELQARNRDLTESLEQQTATSEILRVISNSPTDITPVLDAVAENAARLCEANDVVVMMNEGDVLRAVKSTGPFGERFGANFTIPITRGSASGRAVIERTTVQVADFDSTSDEEFPIGREHRRIYGNHGAMATPLLHGDAVLGVIAVLRRDVRPFSDRQRALLRTFADQAAIAIANVRLFNEIKEALEKQTAISEILRVISASPTDVQPVFDAIVRSAVTLCNSKDGAVFRYDGERLHYAAGLDQTPEWVDAVRSRYPMRPEESTIAGRAILGLSVVQIDDVLADPAYDHERAIRGGWRRMLAVPMLREGVPLGVIVVSWPQPGPTPKSQEDLLRTFADQAVIAIENVRLFNETNEALDHQRASAAVLEVISSSVADTKPVFEKILESCERLFGGHSVGITLVGDDGAVHLGAYHGRNRASFERNFPVPLDGTGTGAAIAECRVMRYPDVEAEGVPAFARLGSRAIGFRSVIFAPMVWEGRGIGAIFVGRDAVGEFSEKEIALLRTFADQAVIAILNAKLFHEIQEKGRQLEIANQHKSAFLANMSHELRTPLNAVIGFSEMLAARYFGDLTEKQAEYVNDIHGSGKHLLSLINDILDLSKIEAGRMELEAAEFDLRAALDNALTLVRERAQRGGVALRLDTVPELGAFVGDERKLKQVVLNLLSNAVKFTPRGGAVDVSARRADGAVEIAVRDTGAGIAPEDQEAIFEAFRQVGTDATRKREGTGLGLALTRRFVELHGGTIRVESAVGKGSTFTVRLPIRHGE